MERPNQKDKKAASQGYDFIAMEKKWLRHWYADGIIDAYLHKNDKSQKRYSFFDGPITANNPMGVHHAWGRTYKDLWQKFYNLQGYKQRFQNGFDCQGLWVEVEVEKELGLKNKKDIENLVPGDSKASIAKFVALCKDRVAQFSSIQTEQSKRLGYFMNWDRSYFTMSSENNYMIWHFLKRCHEHGWIYKGNDSVPWCPRCQTAISQHEMLTEDYKELTHETIFVRLFLTDSKWKHTAVLVWTTTPWTMPANVAVGVNVKFQYGLWEHEKTKERLIIIDADETGLTPMRIRKDKSMTVQEYIFSLVPDGTLYKKIKTISGKELLGLSYDAPFDHLPRVQEAREKHPKTFHTIVDASQVVVASEGTGLLHVAPGAGSEDFQLGKQHHLSVISLIDDSAAYLDGMNELSGKNAKKHPELIIDYVRKNHSPHWLFESMQFTHRYPACWRCKTELVWKVTDEWYIAMDVPSHITTGKQAHKTLREMMHDVAKQIHWMPEFGLERELDWLDHMHDWLISKKNRYWGLALPIWETKDKKHFEVIGGYDELKKRTISGWDQFQDKSPHKPYIDELVIRSKDTGEEMRRVNDVGNVWLDAGIIPFSTLIDPKTGKLSYITDQAYFREWFPAHFITESFPGQFKNWFYALIAMSTVLEYEPPFQTVLGYGTLLGEDGRPMHKSWGNSIEFNEGADKMGVDIVRWMVVRQNPSENMMFGYKKADEVRRLFYLLLWNVYRFYEEYRMLDGISDAQVRKIPERLSLLDTWILSRMQSVSFTVQKYMQAFDARQSITQIEEFISDVSTWYLRRSRDRVWLGAVSDSDKIAFYATMHTVLKTVSIILSPFVPFLSEEIYTQLTGEKSVHLTEWPIYEKNIQNQTLEDDMRLVRDIVEIAHRVRKDAKIKVRQPLASVSITLDGRSLHHVMHISQYELLIAHELNVKKVIWTDEKSEKIMVTYDMEITDALRQEGKLRDLLRQIQIIRKERGLSTGDAVALTIPEEFAPYEKEIRAHVAVKTIAFGPALVVA